MYLLIGVGVIVALLLAAVLVTLLTGDDGQDSAVVVTAAPSTSTATPPDDVIASDDTSASPDTAPPVVPDTSDAGVVVGDPDVIGDAGPCEIVDRENILLDITNSSSEQSDFIITMNFFDAAGQRIGDEPFFVTYLQPGQRALEESFAFETENPDASTCEVAEVERVASEPSDDTSIATCEVVGVDFADDIDLDLSVTNNGTVTSDYSIDMAIIRDDLRIGTAFGSVENVTPGQSAPSDGFSFVPGPADGVTCEVVHLSRTPSG